MIVSGKDIRKAREGMVNSVLRTPMVNSPGLSFLTGANVFLKLENQQVTSSFKPRGAFTKMQSIEEKDISRGVIAMSAGNHAQAVAYHAFCKKIPAVIVMPAQTPFAKVIRTKAWGAEVVLEGRNLNECEGVVHSIIEKRGMTLIHPYDDPLIIAGQGSVGLEMLEDIPDLDVLVVPIGGGGLYLE